jgi:phytoene dehydrogenase-like protein
MYIALALSAALAACQGDTRSTEPPMAPAFARSGGDATPITDATQLAALRKVTARFHSIEAAKQARYVTQITPCWAHHSAGGMGYHYGNTDLFDATVDLLQPETVMYEPQAGGHMRLVGMEYIVPLDAWAAANHDLNDPTDVPQLLGQKFTRHSFLPIFKLHIWLWRTNPSGMFADWNPKVSCQHAESTEIF